MRSPDNLFNKTRGLPLFWLENTSKVCIFTTLGQFKYKLSWYLGNICSQPAEFQTKTSWKKGKMLP